MKGGRCDEYAAHRFDTNPRRAGARGRIGEIAMPLMTLEPALGANDTRGLRRLHALVGGVRATQLVEEARRRTRAFIEAREARA
jgi:hypothetical protein